MRSIKQLSIAWISALAVFATLTVVIAGVARSQETCVPAMTCETNIVGTWSEDGRPFSYTPGNTALEKANFERRRNGVGDLVPDPALQALALQKAKIAASRGIRGHVGGTLGGARAEGVGVTSGRFLSCCLDMPARYGGAAMVVGRHGRVYCCLLVR